MQMKLQLMSKKKKKKGYSYFEWLYPSEYIKCLGIKINEANSLLFKMRKYVNRKILR